MALISPTHANGSSTARSRSREKSPLKLPAKDWFGLKTVRELELISALSFLALVKWPSARSGSGSSREEKTKKRKKSGENRDFVLSRKTGGRAGGRAGDQGKDQGVKMADNVDRSA